ncbi:inner membrane-spanning protein YciB [Sulfitobacter sp. LCG007]
MAAPRKINPWLKAALEFGPILVFFVAYLRVKERTFILGGTEYDGFILVTAAFVPLLVASTLVLWRLTGHLSRMQVATMVLVVVFGGLSVWLNDDRFFKMKPTIIYLLFGGILAFGLLRGKSYLKYVMEEAIPLRDQGWMILTKRLMGCFFALAVLNELVWRTMSTDAWVYFKTFGLTIAVFAFFITQGKLLQTYAVEQDPEA